jgi:signal transduction histidine kinase/ActR/RegA family two-component response regulator
MNSIELSSREYQRQRDSDLAQRSFAGGLVYLGFLAALWATTDYFSSHPVMLWPVTAISVVCGAARFLLGYLFERFYRSNPVAWRAAYFVAINLNILAWGLFLMATFLLYGYRDWKTLLLLICLAGTAPIALAAQTPSPISIHTFMVALTTPIIIASLYLGGIANYTMAMVFTWYLVFALGHARVLHRQYVEYTLEKFALEAAKKSAEEANRAKSAFLANMGHELRTPMNAILGMTHLALNSPVEAERQQYLRMVKSAGENLLEMMNSLLDFSKIEAGKVELEAVPFSVRKLADGTLQSFLGDAKSKGLQLRSYVDASVPLRLRGDPMRLRQVLVNVLGNALKFTERGEVESRITRIPDTSAGISLQFTVHDTGIGIAPEKQRSIFEAFEQGDSSTTRKYGGTGLGLAISARLVELMGGRMWVDSQPGQGSSFHWTARFAAVASKDANGVGEVASSDDAIPSTVTLKILIAEDHEMSRHLLQRLLDMRGYNVVTAANGKDALREMEGQAFDLVLMDMHMPELDGLGTTAEIRRREKGGQPTPVIALTAEVSEGLRDRYVKAGITDYLAKPIKPEKLFELIEQVLKRGSTGGASGLSVAT